MANLNELVGTRASTVDPNTTEYFNKQTNEGFASPTDLANFVSGQGVAATPTNVFEVVKSFSPSSSSINPTVTDKEAVTAFGGGNQSAADVVNTAPDFATYLTNKQALMGKLEGAMKPTETEATLTQQLNNLRNTARNTALSAQSGIQKVEDKVIAMEFITGQAKSIADQANLQLQTLAAQEAPVLDQLRMAKETRLALLDVYKLQLESGRDDFDLAMKIDQLRKQEADTAKKFALDYGVTSEFYNQGGTIYRTADGKAYSTPEEFYKDAGVESFAEAGNRVQTVNTNTIAEREMVMNLAGTYSDAGILPTDSLTTANSKLKNSAIYREKVRPPQYASGGGSGGRGNFTKDENDYLSETLAEVAGFGTRDEAIAAATKLQGSIKQKVGDSGYALVLAEIDRVFPSSPSSSNPPQEETQGFFQRIFGKKSSPAPFVGPVRNELKIPYSYQAPNLKIPTINTKK